MTRIQLPPPTDILFLHGVQNYTEFYLRNGKKLTSSYTLIRHQEKLNGFLRISKAYLVNPLCIKKINDIRGEKEVLLTNGMLIKVSRRRRGVLEGVDSP